LIKKQRTKKDNGRTRTCIDNDIRSGEGSIIACRDVDGIVAPDKQSAV